MKEKKTGTKFTILFNREDPVHVQAAGILNRQPQRGKAHYIAQAIIHYEQFSGISDARHPAQIDEQLIETVARRMVQEIQITGAGGLPVPVGQVGDANMPNIIKVDDITFEDTMEALGDNGFSAITDALAAFRMK